MKRVMVGLLCLLTWAVLAPPVWAQDEGTADLVVTMAWAGHGSPHVRSGGTATWTVTVTNLGPATAQQVGVSAGGADQFGSFASSCGPSDHTCVLGDLAPGDSRTVTFSAKACLISEHRRVWWVTSGADSTTIDPDTSNNEASLDVRITGPFRACPVS